MKVIKMEGLCARIAANDAELVEAFLGYKNLQDAGAKLVCAALAGNTVVHTLWMYSNNLTDGVPFSALLRTNNTLTKLSLGGNPLGATGIAPIMQALLQNDSLRELYLFGTNLSDDGAALVAAALARNCSLETINLGWNDITDCGILRLASALRSNRALKTLYLDSNKCADEGAQAIADMLRVNRTLRDVYLTYNNGMSDIGHRALLDALEHNRVLTELYCNFPDDMGQRVDTLLKRNKNETQLRKVRCRDALVAFLGVRKLHRFESGMWADQPRDVLKIIARYAWYFRDYDQNSRNQNKK